MPERTVDAASVDNRLGPFVTHLAQVAVAAECHYVVRKSETDGVPETRLVEVCGEDRVREIARMLSGDTGEASLAHAREMLGM